MYLSVLCVFPGVSSHCMTSVTEREVCGVFTESSRYLSRPHQRSFTEQNRVLSSYLPKLLCGFFFQEIEVSFMSPMRGHHVGVTGMCRIFFVDKCRKTVGSFEHA